jgi:septal ring factor EnvC (AmiA/AmiB activator)
MRQLCLSIIIVALSFSASAQKTSQDEIKKRQAELQAIRDQIKEYEEKIKLHQKNENEALELLDTYDNKATLVRRLIGKLRVQERELQQTIEKTRHDIAGLETQLDFLKKQYASYVSSIYRTGRTHDLELLLSSQSINQFYLRAEYLKRFSAQRKKDAEQIVAKRVQIEETQAHAQQQLSEERRLIAEKGAEEDRLTSLATERREVLTQIRKNKTMARRAIERQMKAAKELENIISQLIESDRIQCAPAAFRCRQL